MTAVQEDFQLAEHQRRTDLARILRRRVWILILPMLIVPAAAVAFSLSQPKMYSASAQLLFRDPGFDQKLFGGSVLAPSSDPTREAATNVSLVSLDTIALRAADALKGARSADKIKSEVSVTSEGQSDVVNITATDEDPTMAAKVANTIAQQYIEFRRNADRSKIDQALRLVQSQQAALSDGEKNGPNGRSVQQRVEQLQILASLQTGNAELVQPASPPDHQSSPRPVRNGIVGLFLGTLLGLVLVAVAERLDRRIKDRQELESIYGRPVLGTLPLDKELAAHPGAESWTAHGAAAESLRILRANLRYFDTHQDLRSLVVTSAAPGEGKSTIAWGLATTAAAAGDRVLLIEADLRRPGIGVRLGPGAPRGLTDVLSGNVSAAQAIQTIDLRPAEGVSAAVEMDVLVAGPLPMNPTELMDKPATRALLDEVARRYELVIIDTPPVLMVPDAIPLLRQVSGVLLVTRQGQSARTPAHNLRRLLDNLGVTPLGVVVNGAGADGEYGYGYYSYAASEAADGRRNGAAVDDRARSGVGPSSSD